MIRWLLVFLCGGFGSLLRYLVGVQAMRMFGPGWPVGTFFVNLTGGLLMGLLVGFLAHKGGADQDRLRLMLGVGVLGGYTTFSAFSLETALMIERKAFGDAAAYVSGSVVLAVTGVFVGLAIARWLFA